jgi:hypothetical protein
MHADYMSCEVAFQDYASFEVCAYFKEIVKLRLTAYGLTAALKSMPPQNKIPLNPNSLSAPGSLYFDSLDDNEFADQGWQMPVQNVEGYFKYHEVKVGETLQSIAVKYYKDQSFWRLIARENQLYESDLIDMNMSGTVLKIPVIGRKQFSAKSDNNLVYEQYRSDNAQEYQKYLCGADIYLDNGNFLEVDAGGDIMITTGSDCVVANINDRITHDRGSLNPLHPTWGIKKIGTYGNIPFLITLERFLTDIEAQGMNDPRILSAKVRRDTLKLEGAAIEFDIEYTIVGNNTVKAKVNI